MIPIESFIFILNVINFISDCHFNKMKLIFQNFIDFLNIIVFYVFKFTFKVIIF